jgi:hypothetical protein
MYRHVRKTVVDAAVILVDPVSIGLAAGTSAIFTSAGAVFFGVGPYGKPRGP